MKKVYLFGALLMSGLISFGQSNQEPYTFGLKQEMLKYDSGLELNPERKNVRFNAKDRAINVIWSEDFPTDSTGLTTANGDWTQEGIDGSFWNTSTAAQSPTGYDLTMTGKFLMWNSYDPIANGPGGEPNGFATTSVEGAIVSPTIDLAGYTNTALEFELNAQFCCNSEPWSISVSNDDGATWGDEIPLNLNMRSNDNTVAIEDPYSYSIIITDYLDPVAANNNDCKIRFSWDGTEANTNGQRSSHYYWTIDNIKIYELPQYDIQQNYFWLADVENSYEYPTIPAYLAPINFTVQSQLLNYGINEPTNLDLEITIFDESMAILAGPVNGGVLTSAPFLGNESDTITFETGIDLTSYAVGSYLVRAVINYDETDEQTANDTLTRVFRISDNTISHLSADPGTVGYADVINFTSSSSRTGANFSFDSDVDLHGVNLALTTGSTANPSTIGAPISIYIIKRDLSPNANDEEIALFEYTIAEGMLDGWSTFNFHLSENNEDFDAPVTLEAGEFYSIVYEIHGGDVLWYFNSAVDKDFSGTIYVSEQNRWFWNGNEPWINLNLDQTLSIKENIENSVISVSQNMPNPFNNETSISYTLNEASKVTLEIVDVTGKVVASINEGTKTAGEHKITINGNAMSNGIYFYTFNAGEYRTTKRMVVSK